MKKYIEFIQLLIYVLLKGKPLSEKSDFLLFLAPTVFKIDRLLARPAQLMATNTTRRGKTQFCFFEKKFNDNIFGIDIKGYDKTLDGKKQFVDEIFDINPKCMGFTSDLYIFILLKIISFKLKNKIKFDWIAAEYQNYEMSKDISKESWYKRFKSNQKYELLLKYSDIVNSVRIYEYEYFMVTKGMEGFVTTEILVGGRCAEYKRIIEKNLDIKELEDITRKYTNNIVIVSRLEQCKKVHDAIESFLKVKNILEKKSCLVVIGDGSELKKYQNTYQDEDVYFIGAFDHEKTLNSLKYFDFGIMLHGGSSIVEAALAKLPVIAYGFQAMPEYVVDKYSGILIDLNDLVDLEESIWELSNNHDLCKKYGQNAYDVITTRYSDENIQRSINKMDRIMYDH